LPSEQDIAKMKAAEAQQGPKPDIEQEKINVQREAIQSKEKIAGMQVQSKEAEMQQRERSDQNRMELELADTAAKEQITAEQARLKYTMETERIATEIQDRQQNRAHKAQMLNAEMQLKAQLGSGV
jgi:hypothetical protein